MAEAKRPGAATAAGVLEIIFGALGAIVGLFIGIIGAIGALATANIIIIIVFIVSLITLALAVIGFVGGILLLVNKKAGYGLSMIYAIGGLAFNILSQILLIAQGLGIDIGSLIWGAVVPVVILILILQKPVKDFYQAITA